MKLNKIGLAILSLVICSGIAQANNSAPWRVNVTYYGTDSADIKGSDADLSTQAFNVNASTDWLTVGVQHTKYDFSHTYIEPFSTLTKIYADFRTRRTLSTDTVYELGLNVGSLFEDSINIVDDYNIAPRLVFGWEMYDAFTFFVGATTILNKADNVFLPILGIEVGKDKDIGLTGSLAYPVSKLQYRFNPNFAIDTTFLTVRDTYHLNKEDKKGLTKDGYVREESYGVSLGASYNFTKAASLSGGIFSYFDREFKLYNSSGHEVDNFASKNAHGLYLRANVVF